MVNKFYVPGQQRSEKVRDLFAAIAPRYDLINDLQSFGLHRYWKKRTLQFARVRPGDLALDLCCGTGDIAFSMARAGAWVVGLDFSAPMLSVAHQRLLRESSLVVVSNGSCKGSVSLSRGDALHLPFHSDQFDLLTIGYGLRNLADFEGGLREMLRVLKPGGRLVVLDFGKPENPIWRGCYFKYLKYFVPVFGRIFCGDAQTHGYILESLRHYPGQRGVASMLAELGCRNTQVENLMGGVMSINYAEKGSI